MKAVFKIEAVWDGEWASRPETPTVRCGDLRVGGQADGKSATVLESSKRAAAGQRAKPRNLPNVCNISCAPTLAADRLMGHQRSGMDRVDKVD